MNRLNELKSGEEVDESGNEESGQYLTEFFENVGQIKSWMSTIRHNIAGIEEIYGQYITAVSADQTKSSAKELDSLCDETSDLIGNVRHGLESMKEENDSGKWGASEQRIRGDMHNTMTSKFLELITSYQEAQQKYKDMHKAKVIRTIGIVNPDATEEEIQEALDSGGKDMFADGILKKSKYKKEAEETLNYVQNKHKEIQKLERSINELHQLFVDMAVLVESQGELVNQIEQNVESANAYVKKGVSEVKKANEYQRSSRKKMCFLLICFLLILLVIITPIIATSLKGDEAR